MKKAGAEHTPWDEEGRASFSTGFQSTRHTQGQVYVFKGTPSPNAVLPRGLWAQRGRKGMDEGV